MSYDNYKLATPPDGVPFDKSETEQRYFDLLDMILSLQIPDLTGAIFHMNNCPIRELKHVTFGVKKEDKEHGLYVYVRINSKLEVYLWQ